MLSRVDESGVSYRETLQGLIQRTRDPERMARYQEELACPPLPEEVDYLWRIFLRLAARRGSNGFGPNPITWLEMDAFSRLTGIRLAPWEIEVVELLDEMHRRYLNARRPKKSDASSSGQQGAQGSPPSRRG